jgi:hypothetical protein
MKGQITYFFKPPPPLTREEQELKVLIDSQISFKSWSNLMNIHFCIYLTLILFGEQPPIIEESINKRARVKNTMLGSEKGKYSR